jgi:hypothetical protein
MPKFENSLFFIDIYQYLNFSFSLMVYICAQYSAKAFFPLQLYKILDDCFKCQTSFFSQSYNISFLHGLCRQIGIFSENIVEILLFVLSFRIICDILFSCWSRTQCRTCHPLQIGFHHTHLILLLLSSPLDIGLFLKNAWFVS